MDENGACFACGQHGHKKRNCAAFKELKEWKELQKEQEKEERLDREKGKQLVTMWCGKKNRDEPAGWLGRKLGEETRKIEIMKFMCERMKKKMEKGRVEVGVLEKLGEGMAE